MTALGSWQLPPVHLDVALKYLGIERLTLPLTSRSAGYTAEQFTRIAKPELERMHASGVAVADEIAPPLAAALKVLATPFLWVDSIWFPQVGADHCWRALAAFTEGNRVVLGVQAPSEDPNRGGLLTVEVHQNVPLPQVLLGTLPPARPGGQGPVRVPATSLVPPQQEDFDRSSMLRSVAEERGSTGDRQVRLYEAIGGAPHHRIGQLAANFRDRNGRKHRSKVVSWFDNLEPDGRYLNRVERGSSGEQVLALLPADARAIGGEVDALVAQVRG
ncbi:MULTISPECIES: ESX secretion-associated protein EspG [unclassified Saccharopolyspora]|uniref:ESX secretion-associated protein EspG n=1 Tax=unclassified Saccharopolyspora TaxID=2646250 RepID=UPI001CD45470|nr:MULTISPECIES: ESX secretion-associated protein EspG [unclassified Saccharopolyspora]MCA1185526.1 ESX secretion-associated protein EspG [Saccharopolyspora sp. 6T]MCA1192251.1 ESX secretion-associated protein EspG [Saccharopolyspora sp. 6V]MCA1225135.1 ESX secretion-associated protein EspG [Saccharopolyspora sp. 6M]